LLSLGRGDEFYSELKKTLPANLVPDIVTGPPHQQSNFFVGPEHASYGANLFSGFTGSLSWYRQCITRMIGVIPDYNGLLINPLPPRHWNEYAVKRQFRGAKLKIKFHRGDQQSVSLNGKALDGNFISASQLDKDKTYNIKVSYV
jgi:cellobiose phosphorylase